MAWPHAGAPCLNWTSLSFQKLPTDSTTQSSDAATAATPFKRCSRGATRVCARVRKRGRRRDGGYTCTRTAPWVNYLRVHQYIAHLHQRIQYISALGSVLKKIFRFSSLVKRGVYRFTARTFNAEIVKAKHSAFKLCAEASDSSADDKIKDPTMEGGGGQCNTP